MAFAGLCGVIIGIILVKMNTNRKMILLFSAFGTAVAFAILGCYYIFSESNPNSKYMEIKIAKSIITNIELTEIFQIFHGYQHYA